MTQVRATTARTVAARPGDGRAAAVRVAGPVAALVLATGCATAGCAASGAAPAAPPPAEVATSGPDCLADEVLAALPHGTEATGSHPAPRAGSVPDGFRAVRVVECRAPAVLLAEPTPLPVPPPAGGGLSDGARSSGEMADPPSPAAPPAARPAPGPRRIEVLEVTLVGDLSPLLDALARGSDPVPDDLDCPASLESQPQIYLVDAASRAVRAQWPVDACGFLHDGAADTLAILTESASTVRSTDLAR